MIGKWMNEHIEIHFELALKKKNEEKKEHSIYANVHSAIGERKGETEAYVVWRNEESNKLKTVRSVSVCGGWNVDVYLCNCLDFHDHFFLWLFSLWYLHSLAEIKQFSFGCIFSVLFILFAIGFLHCFLSSRDFIVNAVASAFFTWPIRISTAISSWIKCTMCELWMV